MTDLKMKLVPWSRKDTTHAGAIKLTKAQVAQIIQQIGAEQAARHIDHRNIALAYPAYE